MSSPGTDLTEKTIDIPLSVGDEVILSSDGHVQFRRVVDQYVPETALLSFKDSDVGLAEFKALLRAADVIEVVRK